MHEDYLGSEYWGTYKIKSEVSKEEYDKFIEPYPLYKMEDCFTELSFTINNGTASNNSDAITKINALDIPENIKKISQMTDNLLILHIMKKLLHLKIFRYIMIMKNALSML